MPTLREWGDEWLRQKEQEGLRSIRDLRSCWCCHVLESELADRDLADVRRVDVRQLMRELMNKSGRHVRISAAGRETVQTGRPLSRRTVVHVLQAVHSAFAAAVEHELVLHNPAARLRLPPPSVVEAGWTYLTLDEIARIRDSSELPAWRQLLFPVDDNYFSPSGW